MGLLRGLIANAIVGLVIMFGANVIGLGVEISLFTLLICAILGVPGAILVILLSVLGIAFTGMVTPLLLLWACRSSTGGPLLTASTRRRWRAFWGAGPMFRL